MLSFLRRWTIFMLLSLFFFSAQAQSSEKKGPKPYRILSSGKQITVKSNKNILHLMLWTSSGHRVVEQREINATSFNFTIPVAEKTFFLMLTMEGGKIYTEKVGIP